MRYEEREDMMEYKGQQRASRSLGWWCTQCGDAIFSGDALVAQERAFQTFKAEIDKVLNPDDIARIRARLHLSQRRASAILGGGPRSFFKYEAGKQAVSQAMSHLLRLLDDNPALLDKLVAEMELAVAPKPHMIAHEAQHQRAHPRRTSKR
jgi:HTH-type transcriptional regulator / antitoxin MqsA